VIAAEFAGWIASILGLLMWFTLVDQIRLNLRGQKGSWMVACAIVVNCVAWVSYGALKDPCDWPIIVSNAPGIMLGFIAALTARK
jgi:uncharacterized protein with PQ loop repeat